MKIWILLAGEPPRRKVYSRIQSHQNMSFGFKALDKWSEYKKKVNESRGWQKNFRQAVDFPDMFATIG